MKTIIIIFLFAVALSCNDQQFQPIESISYTGVKPILDGSIDSIWVKIPNIPIRNIMYGYSYIEDQNDLNGNIKVIWDQENLYFLIQVVDNVLFTPPYPNHPLDNWTWANWNFDNVNIYLSTNNRSAKFSEKDLDFSFFFNIYEYPSNSINYLDGTVGYTQSVSPNVGYVQSVTSNGYILEIRVPNAEIGLTPKEDGKIGFEILISDNDNIYNSDKVLGGVETQLAWSQGPQAATFAHENTRVYGTLVFKK